MSHDDRKALYWVLLLGIALRLLWAVMIPVEPVSDSNAYDVFARNLVEHGVYGWTPAEPSAYWAVGTSAIVAATYLLLGQSYLGVVVLNLVASAAIIVLTYVLALRYFGSVAAILAAGLIAVWPNLIFFTSILSSELYFIALCLGGLYFWGRPGGRPVIDIVLCGVIWGLACYVRPVVLLLPVALLIADVPRGGAVLARTGLRTVAVIGLIIVVVLPWTLRNDRVLGSPVMVSTNFETNLWMGNNPDSTGGYMDLPASVEGMSEIARADYLGGLAKAYMRENPGATLVRTLRKAVSLHSRETIGVVWNEAAIRRLSGDAGVVALKLIATGFWFAVLLAALAGVALRLKSVGPLATIFHPTLAAWGYFTALHAVIVVEDRYHMPSTPFIAMLAGVTLAASWQKFRPNPLKESAA
jgi:hypothetical protein